MSETHGRRSEAEPLEYHGEPLQPLGPAEAMIEGARIGMIRVEADIRLAHPKVTGALREALGPSFRHGPLTASGQFSGAAYPGAIERLLEATRNHPDYCAACDGFPCQGGHPAGEGA